jgi:hypothetical protein
MLLIVIAMHAFFATGALLEQRMLVTFLKEVRVQGLNFNHLVAVRTLRQQRAVLPEMQIHSLTVRKGFVLHATKLALLTGLTC